MVMVGLAISLSMVAWADTKSDIQGMLKGASIEQKAAIDVNATATSAGVAVINWLAVIFAVIGLFVFIAGVLNLRDERKRMMAAIAILAGSCLALVGVYFGFGTAMVNKLVG